jgi:tRNA threonylcarbamoyladenosine biosynthesis protein TsaE
MKAFFTIKSAKAMMQLGATLATALSTIDHLESFVLYLDGNLGAGKTTLVRGFLRAIGYSGIVRSPTFTLLESYNVAEKVIHHLDLYRLVNADELEYIGIRDFINDKALFLVEWAEKGSNFLPPADLVCFIKVGIKIREVTFWAAQDTNSNAKQIVAFLQEKSKL